MQCSSWTNIEQGYILLFSICKCFSISISCNRFFIRPDYLRKRQVSCLKLLLSHRIFSKFSVKKKETKGYQKYFNILKLLEPQIALAGLWSGISINFKKGFGPIMQLVMVRVPRMADRCTVIVFDGWTALAGCAGCTVCTVCPTGELSNNVLQM